MIFPSTNGWNFVVPKRLTDAECGNDAFKAVIDFDLKQAACSTHSQQQTSTLGAQEYLHLLHCNLMPLHIVPQVPRGLGLKELVFLHRTQQ
jgi:hypothetical protein